MSSDEQRKTGRRIRLFSWGVSLLLHSLLLGFAFILVLRNPPRHEADIELRFEKPTRQEQRPPVQTLDDLLPAASSRLSAPAAPILPVSAPPSPALPDIVVQRPATTVTDAKESFDLPQSPLDRNWTPEEAYAELTRLLEQYPQFREQVLREMIAGKGFAPDTVRKIDLYLDQILANGIKPSWGQQRHAVEGAFSTFNGVSGWSQNGNYGGGVNIFGILKFLIDLIDGE
jgi:hypothetical protein